MTLNWQNQTTRRFPASGSLTMPGRPLMVVPVEPADR
jgi:hypothetical protein